MALPDHYDLTTNFNYAEAMEAATNSFAQLIAVETKRLAENTSSEAK